jgi:hypothetical protein
MSMKKLVVWIILSIVLLGMMAFYIFRMKAKPTIVVTEADLSGQIDYSLGPPAELAQNYDPTQNEARFKIEGVDESTQSLTLNPVWPESFVTTGSKNSKIACKLGDIKIFDQDKAKNGKVVMLKTLFATIQATPADNMIFGGVCGERECREIVRACQLFVY